MELLSTGSGSFANDNNASFGSLIVQKAPHSWLDKQTPGTKAAAFSSKGTADKRISNPNAVVEGDLCRRRMHITLYATIFRLVLGLLGYFRLQHLYERKEGILFFD